MTQILFRNRVWLRLGEVLVHSSLILLSMKIVTQLHTLPPPPQITLITYSGPHLFYLIHPQSHCPLPTSFDCSNKMPIIELLGKVVPNIRGATKVID